MTGSSTKYTANNRCVTLPHTFNAIRCCSFFISLTISIIYVFTNEFLFVFSTWYFFSLIKTKDTAKDESDYSDGYVTDGFATMDVFEYEVDDLSDSEDLESHGSSSGTDVWTHSHFHSHNMLCSMLRLSIFTHPFANFMATNFTFFSLIRIWLKW